MGSPHVIVERRFCILPSVPRSGKMTMVDVSVLYQWPSVGNLSGQRQSLQNGLQFTLSCQLSVLVQELSFSVDGAVPSSWRAFQETQL